MSDGGLKSEAAELDALLGELESARDVKAIAGRRTEFKALDAALNGLSSGLYLVVGASGAGKTAFLKQLCDQSARANSVAVAFFTFNERNTDLRIRTLARLSGIEARDIRRGAGYLLHAYGMSKNPGEDAAPGWQALKAAADGAKAWLARVYLFECDIKTTLDEIADKISAARKAAGTQDVLVAVDSAERLGAAALPFDERLPRVEESLSDLARRIDAPVVATWPELARASAPQAWAERAPGAAAVMVLRETESIADIVRRVTLHIVKNRGGERARIEFDFSPGLAQFIER
ncbi:MAG TPA: DnaB-like helicase C-terminal domain-containing protein [Candidatus Binatia bacterium]|jgi:replicative DNA helicase|nr:DnaB-like helicase C-terminal domain-containing protein [Candidatus Binatia bacterium]